MDSVTQRLMMGAAGASSGPKIYVEDVFSTWLYTGNGSTQTITNGIDLSGKGGAVWFRQRAGNGQPATFDTERGATKWINSASTAAQITYSDTLTAFNSNGFTVGADSAYNVVNNAGNADNRYVSWTFRKAAKFFDVVSYTGSGANRTIAHSLGSVPGTIIVKRTDNTGDWQVYHRSLANTEYMVLNSTAAKATGTTRWNSTTPTSTEFSLGTDATVNASGGTYVAYLFAHDAGGFGDSGNDNVISCGSFTTDGSGDATVNLGWEPQWVLIKNTSSSENWKLVDTMRGFVNNGRGFDDNVLSPNLSSAEATGSRVGYPTATGFFVYEQFSSNTYIYIAIRRGPMKTPTDATKVFAAQATRAASNGTTSANMFTSNFPIDMYIQGSRGGVNSSQVIDRVRGGSIYFAGTANTNAEFTGYNARFDDMDGVSATTTGGATSDFCGWMFRRAPGFFDVVAYTGTGTFGTAISHNLGVAPEMIILKSRSATSTRWPVYQKFFPTTGGNQPEYGTMFLNTNDGWVSGGFAWANTIPTSTQFSVGFTNEANASGATYIAYLFASCPGVSKVGSYTGSGTTKQIDCGFTNGARFVLIKRTDSTGDWYVWDTARGIASGNDPYLLLNSTAAEVTNTDYIDPLNSGFEISSTAPAAINANGGTYIYLAIA